MAKRKRLDPARPGFLAEAPAPAATGPFAPPIAQVAGEAAATAALGEVTQAMERARAEGRLIQRLPLAVVEAEYLVRDRMGIDAEEMSALKESLQARGQQTPIEVVALDGGRYGLISGWRRVTALRALAEAARAAAGPATDPDSGEGPFDTVLAVVRAPETEAEAYVAMVEENEIRVGLSHYERARIVVKAAARGVYESEKKAAQALFAHASRAKRSKITAFVGVFHALDGHLRFPAALGERLGVQLARALEDDAGLAARLSARLTAAAPASAAEEQAILGAALAAGSNPASGAKPGPAPAPLSVVGGDAPLPASAAGPTPGPTPGPTTETDTAESGTDAGHTGEEDPADPTWPTGSNPATNAALQEAGHPTPPVTSGPGATRSEGFAGGPVSDAVLSGEAARAPRPAVRLMMGGSARRPVLMLSGPGLTPDLRARLDAWLAAGAPDLRPPPSKTE